MSSTSLPFVHLGARSDASFGESIARVEELCWEASRDEQDFLALTDVNSLGRAPAFAAAAARAGLRPVFGAEIGVLPHGETQYRGTVYRVRLLVENERGWRNLVRLVSRARRMETPTRPPHVDFKTLGEDLRGLLVFLGGDRGELTQLAAAQDFEKIESLTNALAATAGNDHLFIELPTEPVKGNDLAPLMAQVAGYFNLMTVMVPRVVCAHAADDAVFRLMCQEVVTLGDESPCLRDFVQAPPSARHHLLSRAQVAERFGDDNPAIAATLAIAQHCSQFTLPQSERRFPHGNFGRGVDPPSYIWNTCFSRATERYGDLPTRYKERLNFEFREIVDAGLAKAVVALIRLNEELESEGVQRGPGAGLLTNSVIASLLGLTRLDPLKFDLSFELPAGLGKGSFPLLELSIPANQEDAAAQALSRLFEGQVARVGEWRPWKPAAVLERLAQMLGKDGKWAGRMAKNPAFVQEKQLAADQPATWQPDGTLPADSPAVAAWIVARMAGRARELAPQEGVYTFAVDAIEGTAPLRRREGAPPESAELPVSEWTSEELGRLRHGRIAFVHSPLLDLIGESTELVRQQGNETYAPEQTAFDDAATYRLLREGRTLGITPLESPVIRKRLRQGQPVDLHALIKILKAEGHDIARENLPDFSTILLCHVCASIKANNPAAFYAAALSQSQGDTRQTTILLDEARERGIAVSELLINFSSWRWTVEGNALRPGFQVVKGLTAAAASEILRKRQEMHFSSLADVCKRTDKNRLRATHLRALIKAGAFDRLCDTRREPLLQLEEFFPLLRARNGNAPAEDASFFGHDADWWIRENESADSGGETIADIMQHEREAIGYNIAAPLSPEEQAFLEYAAATFSAQKFHLKMEGREITFLARPGAVVPDRENPGTVLMDAGGILVHAGGTAAERLSAGVYTGQRVVVTGVLHREPFQWHLKVASLASLGEAMERARVAQGLVLDLSKVTVPQQKALLALLKRYPGETRLIMEWMPANATRLVRAIASREVLLCPLLELGLDRVLGAGEWSVAEDVAAADRTSADRVRLMGRRVSSIAVRKLTGLFSRHA